MENKKELLEILADLEHQQWMEWSKAIAGADEKISEDRLDKWAGLWISYKKLSEENKEKDRIWARKVLLIVKQEIDKIVNGICKDVSFDEMWIIDRLRKELNSEGKFFSSHTLKGRVS